ncbi:MAG: ChbG/HpnK family deacetylase [Candidatus Omnitrophica bacterium]|nr:ChbG/HpnK family deacetylase [Candidatus Omnitrophota bacterium]
MQRLIVNADDLNLTRGVTRSILQAHDEGIVTSTTALVNLPLEIETIRKVKKRNNLGVGIHLNVTLGSPVSRSARVPSLIKEEGKFKRPADYLKKMPQLREVVHEYEAQIELFQKHFGRKPDHFDTHHHLHDHPLFFQAVSHLASRWKVPVRRCQLVKDLKTTDYLFGNLSAQDYWRKESFLSIAANLPIGTSEIGCHPGFCDSELRKISSMQDVRLEEFKLFSDRKLRKVLADFGIELIRFSDI